MNRPTTELTTTQSKQEYIKTDEPSSKDCGSGEKNVHSDPARTAFWEGLPSDVRLPEILSCLHHHTIQPGFVDPLSLRFHCPCHSTQCQITYPGYLLEPQSIQYYPLTDTVPGPPCSSHPNIVSALRTTSVASICVPHLKDHQQLQEGLTEVTSNATQAVVCNVIGGEQVVNLCEPGPVFFTLESAPTYRDDGLARGKDVNLSGNSNQLPQYHQVSCALDESMGQIASIYSKASFESASGTMRESKSKKPCRCTRSQCLKLYCECFANGVMCSNCDCSNCHNNAEHERKRNKAIKSCLGRNPDAFRPKFACGNSGEVKGWHNKGCNCKRSSCLKNYCECYEANIMCTSSCKCVGCRNFDNGIEMARRDRSDKDTWPLSMITPAVVEAVCSCLLAQAEEAEREAQSPTQAEHMVLNEFGHCLTQIVKAMFK